MYIDRLLYPVTALGPGNRVALWVAGCGRHCKNCANPELWQAHPYQKTSPEKLAGYIDDFVKKGIDGLTVTGGEPFDQAPAIAEMIHHLSEKPELLIFSGYKYEELLTKEDAKELLKLCDVLIDGEYIEELNDDKAVLRGSLNQQIHYLNENVRDKYEAYLKEGRKIQNFIYDYRTVSVGIHNR